MTMTDVSQGGSLFRVSWTLDIPEAVTIARTLPTAETLAVLPALVTQFVDTIDGIVAATPVAWTLTGEDSAGVVEITATAVDMDAPPLDDDRRFLAAMLVAARLYKRKDSPFGVAGGGELGSIMLRFKDPDVEMLLVGLRRTSTDMSTQTWPTVAELRAHVKAGTAIVDAELTPPLAAAIGIVTRRCAGAGIA